MKDVPYQATRTSAVSLRVMMQVETEYLSEQKKGMALTTASLTAKIFESSSDSNDNVSPKFEEVVKNGSGLAYAGKHLPFPQRIIPTGLTA